ncbi:TorF family putative porin [Frateuria defendens]|uniref:TorF family putative porin n=1 Tax=Frateuria defendens TaxID=2219559 RepID=UPI00066FF4BC|nr:TorF family putative porin [Frateuria defendens]
MAVGIALFATGARAQASGKAMLVSDYRFRGVSLSDERPAVQVALGYDPPARGWYAGGVLSSVRLERRPGAQLAGYAGYAWRATPDLSWEVGSTYTRFSGRDAYAYAEAYAGFTYRRLVGRVYYAPDYFHAGTPALYAELNASRALGTQWYVFGHLGYLRRRGAVDEHRDRARIDLRLGLGLTLAACTVQLSWTAVQASNGSDYAFGYPVGRGASREAWVLGVSYAW